MLTIVTALKAEAEPLISVLPETKATACGPGSLRPYKNFHLLRCGVGKQKATASFKTYLQLFKPHVVLLTGFAGALNQDFKTGQIFKITKLTNAQSQQTFELTSPNFLQTLPAAHLLTVPRAVTTEEQNENLRTRFGADLVDMEAFHLAEICYQQQIELWVVKGVTDNAGNEANKEFKQNYREVAFKIFEILRPLLKIEL